MRTTFFLSGLLRGRLCERIDLARIAVSAVQSTIALRAGGGNLVGTLLACITFLTRTWRVVRAAPVRAEDRDQAIELGDGELAPVALMRHRHELVRYARDQRAAPPPRAPDHHRRRVIETAGAVSVLCMERGPMTRRVAAQIAKAGVRRVHTQLMSAIVAIDA